jgi:hypothetical protein
MQLPTVVRVRPARTLGGIHTRRLVRRDQARRRIMLLLRFDQHQLPLLPLQHFNI